MSAYVVDVEGLADADGDECLAAEALHGEGHAARRDVPDRPEGLEDPHLLSLSGRFSRAWLRRRRGGRAGGEGFRVGLGRRKRRQSGGGRRGGGG